MCDIKKLGKYEIVEELGFGAMGKVYKAKDPTINRFVALKTINLSLTFSEKERAEFSERFHREAQTAGQLSHQNIITIYEVAEDEEKDLSYIAMEFASGAELKDIISSPSPIPISQIVNIVSQIAEALDYAHQHGIVHRDIKPANIIINSKGILKVTDFGIAKIATSNLTDTGKFLGTPYYMSPEQIDGQSIDGRSDLFSLGVILYQMLTKQMPFKGDSVAAVTYAIAHKPYPKPSSIDDSIPKFMDSIVAKLLNKDRDKRYSSGRELIEELKLCERKYIKGWDKNNSLLGDKKSSLSKTSGLILAIFAIIAVMAIAIFIFHFGKNENTPLPLVLQAEKTDRNTEQHSYLTSLTVDSAKPIEESKNSDMVIEQEPVRQEQKAEPILKKKIVEETGTKAQTKTIKRPPPPVQSVIKKPATPVELIPVAVKLTHSLKKGGNLLITSNQTIYLDDKILKKGRFKKAESQDWNSVKLPKGEHLFEIYVISESLKHDATLIKTINIKESKSFKLVLELDKMGNLEVK